MNVHKALWISPEVVHSISYPLQNMSSVLAARKDIYFYWVLCPEELTLKLNLKVLLAFNRLKCTGN